MANLDIFNNDAFSLTELTKAIVNTPKLPTRIGDMGLFSSTPMTGTSMWIERTDMTFNLVPSAPRGAPGKPVVLDPRNAMLFHAIHLPQRGAVDADEAQGIRAFGETTELQSAQALVTAKLAKMRTNLDLTIEYQRVGALMGVIYDADGTSVIADMYATFGVSQQVFSMNLDDTTENVRKKVVQAKRLGEAALGNGIATRGWMALCASDFFDAFVAHPSVERTYLNQPQASQLRTDYRPGFDYGEVNWQEYTDAIDGVPFIPAGTAILFPIGVKDMFQTFFAPANFMETVNTPGLPYYARQKQKDFNMGVELHSQSNPLSVNSIPRAVVKLTLV